MALDETIWISPYELKVKGSKSLNSRSTSLMRYGALLRVGDGFADLHPWPELGDEDLKAQLRNLSQGKIGPQLKRSLDCARLDGEARKKGKSLFCGLDIPPSHWTVTDVKDLGQVPDDFDFVKIKVGKDLQAESQALSAFLNSHPQKLRLDFNNTSALENLNLFLSSLNEEQLDAIDFCEDPCPYDPKSWQGLEDRFKIRLAIDKKSRSNSESKIPPHGPLTDPAAHEGGFSLVCVKPAVEDPIPWIDFAARNMKRLVVTSYMDHPLGQTFAAFEAARIWPTLLLETCGFLTHDLFEENDFQSSMRRRGPVLEAPKGTGLGFDELLSRQKWQKL